MLIYLLFILTYSLGGDQIDNLFSPCWFEMPHLLNSYVTDQCTENTLMAFLIDLSFLFLLVSILECLIILIYMIYINFNLNHFSDTSQCLLIFKNWDLFYSY